MAKKPPTSTDVDRRHAEGSRRNAIALPPEVEVLGEAARNAWTSLRKTFEQWISIGQFVVALRARAEQIGGRYTFQRLMIQEGLEALISKRSKAVLSRLERIMHPDNLSDVLKWHTKLSPEKQVEWSSPSSVIRNCSVFPKPERDGRSVPSQTPEEIRSDKRIEELEAHVAELEAARENESSQATASGTICSFCEKSKDEVNVLITGALHGAAICNECIDRGVEIIRKQEEANKKRGKRSKKASKETTVAAG
jgi:hypothetical protein